MFQPLSPCSPFIPSFLCFLWARNLLIINLWGVVSHLLVVFPGVLMGLSSLFSHTHSTFSGPPAPKIQPSSFPILLFFSFLYIIIHFIICLLKLCLLLIVVFCVSSNWEDCDFALLAWKFLSILFISVENCLLPSQNTTDQVASDEQTFISYSSGGLTWLKNSILEGSPSRGRRQKIR